MRYANGYAEPGYTDPAKVVIFANWNYFASGVDSILERYGYSLEWDDEWGVCEGCNKAVRTSPDSYGWQPSFVLLHDCEIVCVDCLNGDAGDYLESLENNPRKALNLPSIDPAEWGYARLEDGFENGWHPGQNDNPQEIFKRLTAQYPRLLFQITGVGQFDVGFAVWSHPEE
jgi:hypothetical protein